MSEFSQFNRNNKLLMQKPAGARVLLNNFKAGEIFMLFKRTWKTLFIVFLTYAVTFMCYPSIIYMYFTLLDYYLQVINVYDYSQNKNDETILMDAAKDYLVLYALLIIFSADLFATLT